MRKYSVCTLKALPVLNLGRAVSSLSESFGKLACTNFQCYLPFIVRSNQACTFSNSTVRQKSLTKHNEKQCLPSSGTKVKNYPELTGENNTSQVINLAGLKQTAMRSPTSLEHFNH